MAWSEEITQGTLEEAECSKGVSSAIEARKGFVEMMVLTQEQGLDA